jgi:hypothetical protein
LKLKGKHYLCVKQYVMPGIGMVGLSSGDFVRFPAPGIGLKNQQLSKSDS